MNDDLDQLLKNLRLHRIREVFEHEVERANKVKRKPSYSEFVARLLREQYQYQRERCPQIIPHYLFTKLLYKFHTNVRGDIVTPYQGLLNFHIHL